MHYQQKKLDISSEPEMLRGTERHRKRVRCDNSSGTGQRGGEGRRPPAVRRGQPLGREGRMWPHPTAYCALSPARHRHRAAPPASRSPRAPCSLPTEAAAEGTYVPSGQATEHNNIARGSAAVMAWAWALGGGRGEARICVGGRVVWVAGAATNGMAGAPRITKLGALAGRPETSRGVTWPHMDVTWALTWQVRRISFRHDWLDGESLERVWTLETKDWSATLGYQKALILVLCYADAFIIKVFFFYFYYSKIRL